MGRHEHPSSYTEVERTHENIHARGGLGPDGWQRVLQRYSPDPYAQHFVPREITAYAEKVIAGEISDRTFQDRQILDHNSWVEIYRRFQTDTPDTQSRRAAWRRQPLSVTLDTDIAQYAAFEATRTYTIGDHVNDAFAKQKITWDTVRMIWLAEHTSLQEVTSEEVTGYRDPDFNFPEMTTVTSSVQVADMEPLNEDDLRRLSDEVFFDSETVDENNAHNLLARYASLEQLANTQPELVKQLLTARHPEEMNPWRHIIIPGRPAGYEQAQDYPKQTAMALARELQTAYRHHFGIEPFVQYRIVGKRLDYAPDRRGHFILSPAGNLRQTVRWPLFKHNLLDGTVAHASDLPELDRVLVPSSVL